MTDTRRIELRIPLSACLALCGVIVLAVTAVGAAVWALAKKAEAAGESGQIARNELERVDTTVQQHEQEIQILRNEMRIMAARYGDEVKWLRQQVVDCRDRLGLLEAESKRR